MQMTEAEAQKEATRRWGTGTYAVSGYGQCCVGKGKYRLGRGTTFENAFEEADRKRNEAIR